MCDKMAISAYILKIVEKDPFLRLQMRAKEMFNHHQFFSTNEQYVKINPLHAMGEKSRQCGTSSTHYG